MIKELLSKEGYFKKYEYDEEETNKDQILTLDYPKPVKKYRIVYDSFQSSIEETYYWILQYLRYDQGFAEIDKITDLFSAAEASAFGGMAHQRVGLSQDKVTGFLAAIGKMTKDLFQLVRELRILDERRRYYKDSKNPEIKIAEPAEITLKGIYVDMAEGGAKSPASVYGMARELQFTTLPDLFFGTTPRTPKEVGKVVDALDFNEQVKRVLKRKLYSFLRWKTETEKELESRRVFTLKYLKQHYEVIKMYMNWVKPYLKRIRKLEGTEKAMQSPDLITAFETSLVEIEFLAKFKPKDNNHFYTVVVYTFEYRTKPSLNYNAEHYQRGPIHIGEIKVTSRGYTWTKEDVENYKHLRDMEDLELLKSIDESVRASMEALGGELEKYLAEAAKGPKEEKPKKPKLPSVLDPFLSVFKGLGDAANVVMPKGSKKEKKPSEFFADVEKEKARREMKLKMWLTYKNYKKSHKMLSW